jgi:hypothetical protein
MTKPVVWRLHCAVCNWAPAADQPISDAKDHWDEHTDEQRASFDGFSLNLVPHCPEDDAPYAPLCTHPTEDYRPTMLALVAELRVARSRTEDQARENDELRHGLEYARSLVPSNQARANRAEMHADSLRKERDRLADQLRRVMPFLRDEASNDSPEAQRLLLALAAALPGVGASDGTSKSGAAQLEDRPEATLIMCEHGWTRAHCGSCHDEVYAPQSTDETPKETT